MSPKSLPLCHKDKIIFWQSKPKHYLRAQNCITQPRTFVKKASDYSKLTAGLNKTKVSNELIFVKF